MEIHPKKDPVKGALLSVQSIARKAEISESTIKRIIQLGYIEPIKIGGRRYMYYRDFLRAVWEYEEKKERSGPKNAKTNSSD